MDQNSPEPLQVTLTEDAEVGGGDKETILKTPSGKGKRKDHKKGRSNSLCTKKSEGALDSPEGSPKARAKKDLNVQQQRRCRRKRMAQGMKPCPQEILDETSWETRVADYFVIVSPEATDGDRRHSTFLTASITLAPVVTDRVPHENYKDTKLPMELGNFCFPDGIAPVLAAERPSSLFHCFNLTDENGTRLYVACLRSFKKSDPQVLPEEKMCGYIPVALCIVSHHPFISLFKAYLCKISEIMAAPSESPRSAEAYISTILFNVPMPTPGVSEVVCSIDESHEAVISIPSKIHFPIVDVIFLNLIILLINKVILLCYYLLFIIYIYIIIFIFMFIIYSSH